MLKTNLKGSIREGITNYYTNCPVKDCKEEVWIRGKTDLTKQEIVVIFSGYGWELFPSRCPKHNIKDDKDETKAVVK